MTTVDPMRSADDAPIPAATVMLVRDGARGLEVLMLRRQESLRVHGGAFVFPGGKVDAEDYGYADAVDPPIADRLRQALGEPDIGADDALAIHIAAMRETWEESGILIGVEDAAAQTVPARADAPEPFSGRTWGRGARLNPFQLVPWSRWITPAGSLTSNRRFDTRFFVCMAPEGQSPCHDEQESSASLWIRPGDALSAYGSGELLLVPPQILTLGHLAACGDAQQVLAHARARTPYVVRPLPMRIAGETLVAYPGDELHPEPNAVMPGPTRMFLREGRYFTSGGKAP